MGCVSVRTASKGCLFSDRKRKRTWSGVASGPVASESACAYAEEANGGAQGCDDGIWKGLFYLPLSDEKASAGIEI